MPIRKVIIFIGLVWSSFIVKAQTDNPFEAIGKTGKVLTASGGKFVETFDYDSIQRIGSVLLNIKIRRIVKLLPVNRGFRSFSDNSASSRWWRVDPDADKYVGWSPYNFASNNPIRFNDPSGKAPNDIVTFNDKGQEISRVKSSTVFKTYVQVEQTTTADFKNGSGPQTQTITVEAPMPGVAAGFGDPKYQANDYQIAASTYLMNRSIAQADMTGNTSGLPTPDASHTVGSNLPGLLDVNVVKAMELTESVGGTISGNTGTGTTDVMQVNVSGDWNSSKTAVGLTKGQDMTPATSINAAVPYLFMKGMGSDATGEMNWRNGAGGNWSDAVQRYNGGGDPNYVQKVQTLLSTMAAGTPVNY